MAKPSKKSGRKVRVAFRRNRNEPARVKDWKKKTDDGQDDIEEAPSESIVAKGDLSRHRTVIVDASDEGTAETSRGKVISIYGLVAQVDDGHRVWPCTLRRILRTRKIDGHHPITVGDSVHFSITSDVEGVVNEGVIERIDPRHGELKRRVGKTDHVVVANIDQVLIVSSAGVPAPKPHLIDRYLVAAHAGGIEPIICLNKTDLDMEGVGGEVLEVYKSLGYPTVATSTVNGQGIDELRSLLQNKESVLAGQSGVGKSSLLNVVQPGLELKVGDVIEQTQKGRHTTTSTTLLRLDVGGYVVDTPGVKSFDVASVPLAELEMHFIEFVDLLANCKYPDCTHIHEPACAIKTAAEAGEIGHQRYESYARMYQERAG